MSPYKEAIGPSDASCSEVIWGKVHWEENEGGGRRFYLGKRERVGGGFRWRQSTECMCPIKLLEVSGTTVR